MIKLALLLLLLTAILIVVALNVRGLIQDRRARREADEAKQLEEAKYLPNIWCQCHPPIGKHPIDEPLPAGNWDFR